MTCLISLVVFVLGCIRPCSAFVIATEGAPEFRLNRSGVAHVSVEYSIEGGLFNQHMDHSQTMMLAVALQAQRLWWVPSLDRNTYGVSFNRMRWRYIESSEIYDMESIRSFASGVFRV